MFAVRKEDAILQENLVQEILLLLGSGRFLTIKEIATLLSQPEATVKSELFRLMQAGKLNRRHFAGRDYFQTVQPQTVPNAFSMAAEQYLDRRHAAQKLGNARTCYHHLAGKAGIALFDQLLTQKLITLTTANAYRLTEKGQHVLARYLGHPVRQRKVQTCIDFSERRVHLAGKLGDELLAKLVANHQMTLSGNRLVRVLHPIGQKSLAVSHVS
ncbi:MULTISPECIES: response regulator transcription factor [Lacticaseibacillus]|uniref:Response regulator transcription factor n=2 Tax=Lacticaseibacillus TaxID=2759736 RepID=A0AAN1KFL0_LACCA|nr:MULTISPECIES: response regulator transcription factor [Lacticaseibacillus]ARY92951.1 transcriptional regulator [Lacticaseibacillus casei]KAB1970503.1 response regulator transcription factor [Lacticaseibacillus casei]WLV81262.1 response regulator transcription factor [Lacticaseibacillus sp. NCIMB 15473]WNX25222.1 response regulator transcription factor [Lacticaseibacillus casei]WNX27993.1 response regulator transcription factor [Lacticaseibacillus casei]